MLTALTFAFKQGSTVVIIHLPLLFLFCFRFAFLLIRAVFHLLVRFRSGSGVDFASGQLSVT